MTKAFNLLDLNLSLFDGAPAGAAPAGDGGSSEAAGDSQQQALPTRKGKKTGELDKVVYGKQPTEGKASGNSSSDAGSAEQDIDPMEAKRAEFQRLIKGDYKDLYTDEVQTIINRRFADSKMLEKQVAESQTVLDRMMARYGVNDIAALDKAIDNDDDYWCQKAADAGMDVESYKEYEQTIRENAKLKEAEEARQQQTMAQKQVEKWIQEAGAMKADGYPDFNLQSEFANPEFERLLKSGIPVKHAYEVVHLNDIKHNVAASTATQTKKAVTENVRARGQRPAENGTGSQSGVIIKSDPSKFSAKDRAEIARRVQRGEQIEF